MIIAAIATSWLNVLYTTYCIVRTVLRMPVWGILLDKRRSRNYIIPYIEIVRDIKYASADGAAKGTCNGVDVCHSIWDQKVIVTRRKHA